MTDFKTFRSYLFLIILLSAMVLGGITGYLMGDKAVLLKPFGDVFLNLMFMVVVPLIFFSIASAVANMSDLKRLGKIMAAMFACFIFTSIIAGVYMLAVLKVFPPASGVVLNLTSMPAPKAAPVSIGQEIVNIITVPDFMDLFSRNSILALIFFSVLVGLATSSLGEKAKPFALFLNGGMEIAMKTVSYVMYYAPIGFFAYFAVLSGQLGPQLFATYFRASAIYYIAGLLYFFIGYTFYAYLAAKGRGVRIFWKNAPLPTLTALATCSSAASIPANLQATKEMGPPPEVYETVVPLGAIVHKDGSVLGGAVKIAFLFGIFHLSFSGPMVLLTALLVSILVGTVIGAIPSGGMVAEILILSLYGFPPQALIIIAAITILIDPLATMLNVTGNSVCSMLTARLVEGKNWLKL